MDLHNFRLRFVPLFIAADSIGALPVCISITERVKRYGFPKPIVVSGIAAGIVGLPFVCIGEFISIIRLIGKKGTNVILKIESLFLAAIAVMIVRKGLFAFLQQK